MSARRLLQAAREAGWNAAFDHGTRNICTNDVYLIVDAALTALFAALPECKEAVETAGWSFPSEWLVDDYHAEVGRRALAALAQAFGEAP